MNRLRYMIINSRIHDPFLHNYLKFPEKFSTLFHCFMKKSSDELSYFFHTKNNLVLQDPQIIILDLQIPLMMFKANFLKN